MRKIDKIIVHCTASPELRPHDVNDIRLWHQERGWDDIGYHYLIHIDGTIEEGRPIERYGIHTAGQNYNSIGVCYVGGMTKDMKSPKDTRTKEQKDSLIKLIQQLIYKYNKDMTIHGHNEFSNKACPCFDVKKEYAIL
ncbi:MAG: putative endolysin [Prokaryotic dsDNA virus sp.]|mgnify:CR=1 FL=1|nr:MAG: putative endolysin [Prokaryotic dsDNA virus sp.]|tara:strand:- start:537 stop:950 length:414 start_codon:yes stop_codon:yes gene_type:complete